MSRVHAVVSMLLPCMDGDIAMCLTCSGRRGGIQVICGTCSGRRGGIQVFCGLNIDSIPSSFHGGSGLDILS